MTVFAVHPEAIIQGRLLYRPRLLTGKLWYVVPPNFTMCRIVARPYWMYNRMTLAVMYILLVMDEP